MYVFVSLLLSDLLFGTIYDTFCGEGSLSKSVFLELLYDHVIEGRY